MMSFICTSLYHECVLSSTAVLYAHREGRVRQLTSLSFQGKIYVGRETWHARRAVTHQPRRAGTRQPRMKSPSVLPPMPRGWSSSSPAWPPSVRWSTGCGGRGCRSCSRRRPRRSLLYPLRHPPIRSHSLLHPPLHLPTRYCLLLRQPPHLPIRYRSLLHLLPHLLANPLPLHTSASSPVTGKTTREPCAPMA